MYEGTVEEMVARIIKANEAEAAVLERKLEIIAATKVSTKKVEKLRKRVAKLGTPRKGVTSLVLSKVPVEKAEGYTLSTTEGKLVGAAIGTGVALLSHANIFTAAAEIAVGVVLGGKAADKFDEAVVRANGNID